MDKSIKNSKLSYAIALVYGGIGLFISSIQVISAVSAINKFNDKSAVGLAYMPSFIFLLFFIFISFVISLIWYIKKKNLPSKICMILLLISILLLLGFIIYFII